MPFLTVQGITVPCGPDNTQQTTEESQLIHDRSAGGTYFATRTAIKRRFSFKSIVLASYRAHLVRQLIQGLGHSFPYDADLYSSGGLAPVAVGNAFVDTGNKKYGAGAAYVASALSNLFTSNIATGTDTLGNTTGFTGTNATISSSATYAWQGTKSLKAIGTAGFSSVGFTCAVLPNTTYTFSVYVTGGFSGSNYQCGASVSTDGAGGGSATLVIGGVNTDGWQRMSFSYTTGAGATTSTFSIGENVDDNATYYFDGFMLTIGGTLLAWQNGTTTPALEYPGAAVATWPALTAMLWVRGPDTGTMLYIDDGVVKNKITIAIAAGTYSITTVGPAGTTTTATYALGVDGNWHHVAVVISVWPTPQLLLIIDGVLRGTTALVDVPSFAAMTRIQVGHALGANAVSCQIDDLMLLPYPLTAADVTAMYSLAKSVATLPTVLVGGDLVANSPILMLGEADQADVHMARDAALTTFDASSRMLAFNLQEP